MTDTHSPQGIKAKLDQLRDAYLQKLPETLRSLAALAERAKDTSSSADIASIHAHLHKLAGNAGTFGFRTLSRTARELEIAIEPFIAGGVATTSSTETPNTELVVLLEKVQLLHREVATAETLPSESLATSEDIPAVPKTNTIWIWDTDPALNHELAQQLESFNYDVQSIDELQPVLNDGAVPDVVIISGDLLNAVNADTSALNNMRQLLARGTRLVVIAEREDFELRVAASRMGAIGFFLKPLSIPSLIARFERSLAKRESPPMRVMVVDDDEHLREYCQLILTHAGMDVAVVANPRTLVVEMEAFSPELVLMDLHMPDYSGTDLAGVIRQYEKWASMPIVYLSAETALDQQIHAMSQGADDFLTKPIVDTQLIAAVQARIERSRLLAELITKDSLTGLLKHASVKESVEREVSRAQRVNEPVSVAMIDIDFFKRVNDTYGHATGDVVICALATLLRQRLRTSDILGRYGGEEFVVVLPACNLTQSRILLDSIRERFSQIEFDSGKQRFSCTLSAGVACSAQHPDVAGEELLAYADKGLYRAKHLGRNTVSLFEKDESR